MRTAAELFWPKVNVGWTDECWEWGGSLKPNGYGQFTSGPRKGYSQYAHRAAYHMIKGDPGSLVIDHLCHNKGCCNPAHLEAVTQAINVRRAHDDGLVAVKTHRPSGHEYTDGNVEIDGNARRCKVCRRKQKVESQRRKRAFTQS